MARRTGGATRRRAALGAVLVGALLAGALAAPLAAADSPEAEPTPEPPAPTTATDTSPAVGAISRDDAADKATEAYVEASDETADDVQIVTVEATPEGPKFETHDVDSAAEARDVATDAARGRDLVGIDVDRPMQAFDEPIVGVDLDTGPVSVDAQVPNVLAPPDETSPPPTVPPTTTTTPTPTSPKPPKPTPTAAQKPKAAARPTTSKRISRLAAESVWDVRRKAAALATFTDDPYSQYQWPLNPQLTSFLDAWKVTRGGGVTVAVVDTGVAANHPDLAGRILRGHEFLGGGSIDRDISSMTDNCGHGTHVAGTIAAVPQNKIGVAGVAPLVKILPVRVLNCGGWSSDVAKGITWAANKGAKVINLSVGGPGPDRGLLLAVRYARSKGAVVVAAAGNNHGACTPNKNATSYPGATTGAIGVGAIDVNLAHACFSNTGTYVDIAAPGVAIVSTVPTGTGYAAMNGTSMATPHVAGAAALVLAKRPYCKPDQVEARLKSTARRLPLNTLGNARLFGAGLVNPGLAVRGSC